MFKLIQGKTPLVFSAPHNTVTTRSAKRKPRDINTGKVVQHLCDKHNAWGIITTKVQKDPNWYTDSFFRRKLKQLVKNNKIKVVFDIHGRKRGYEHLLEIYPNQTFKDKYSQLLDNLVIKKFKDNEQLTIVEDFERLNVAGIEIEIRREGREPKTKSHNKVIRVLDELISEVIKKHQLDFEPDLK